MKVSVQISLNGSPPKQAQLNGYDELRTWIASLGPDALSITNVTWQILDLEQRPAKSITFEPPIESKQPATELVLAPPTGRLKAGESSSWFDHWVTSFLIRLFPTGALQEEMKGDLLQTREAMLKEANRPQWFIDLQILGKIMVYAVKWHTYSGN